MTTITTNQQTAVTFAQLRAAIVAIKRPRSAWGRGVQAYALMLIDNRDDVLNKPIIDVANLRRVIQNGADSWSDYSWGGSAYIYDADIAEQLCTPSELKRTDHGRLRPNRREAWLDTQARALYQAAELLVRTYRYDM